ncbi:MAG: GH116 family glycosyl hydrolase [Bacteroidales bacterium]|nr:GH116 family glycosyl hydrolase [Bacteroidales bacterium]
MITIFLLTLTNAGAQSVKGKSMRMHSVSLTKTNPAIKDQQEKPIVGFVSLLPYDQADTGLKSAFDILKNMTDVVPVFITIRELEKQLKRPNRFSILWFHRPDTTAFSVNETSEKLILNLKAWVENGGHLFLTQQAAHYLNILGYESLPLKDSTKSCIDDGYGRKLGFHAFRQHSIFNGLNGGAYINRPVYDLTTRITGFFGDQVPRNGKVVAVDWDYIFLREGSKLVFEYSPGSGKVLAVGGYMNFTLPNLNREHLVLFTRNCIEYLSGKFDEQRKFYWDYSPNTVHQYPPRLETNPMNTAIPYSVSWKDHSGDLTLRNRFASVNFWDVAGERLLTMGTEKGGIEEVWAHPFMAFRDYEVGIKFGYRDTIFWLSDERPEIAVDPACFSREYKFPRAYLKETIVNDPVDPNGVIHYEYRGVYPAALIIQFKSNLRWMWPYSERVTGSICHSWDGEMGAFTLQDKSGDLNVIIGGTKEPLTHLSGQYEDFNWSKTDSSFHGIPTEKFQVACLLQYGLEMNDNLDVIYTASSEGNAITYGQYRKAIHQPKLIFDHATNHADELLSKSLTITSPDQDFNTGYRWALLATDRFFVNTPGMGEALVAGYSTTSKGWNGGHKVNGRPGYGWYFGRDAEWSGFALLDYGDFTKVRSQLEFFNRYQDFSGKIFHEVSTSGFIHYDAADATPLYIVLAGKYFRHTNDTAFLRKTWPNIKKAINFCFSTDTDHDHLIENTNVGHGWVEGGELYGSHATLYMAGIWGAALTEASTMAAFMKDYESESYRLEVRNLQKIINTDFWDNNHQFFSYGKNKDGSFRHDATVLLAVPLYFRMTDRQKARICLRQYASNAFTTDWGVRIIREDNPMFRPTGYHYGSVWPLFTGWTALAEYNSGNFIQGYSHLMNNLNIYKSWGLGFVEEVLNGAEYLPSGVCPHQCWSETMVLQPAIEGLLGLEINAPEQKITLAPHLPANWDSLTVRNIRIGEQRVGFNYKRTGSNNIYDFSPDQEKQVMIEFMPSFPAGTLFTKVTLDDREIPYTSFKDEASMTLLVRIKLINSSCLNIETEGGISVIPVVSDPRPGYGPEGLRILGIKLSGNHYNIDVEGKSGTSGIFEVYSTGSPVNAKNARYLNHNNRIYRYVVDFEPSELKYGVKTVTLDDNE